MKKLCGIVICLSLIINLTSCNLQNEVKNTISNNNMIITDDRIDSSASSSKEYNLVSSTVLLENSEYNTTNSAECYSCLTEYSQRTLYNQMKKNVYYICDDVSNDESYYIKRIVIKDIEMPVQEIRMTFQAFINDNVDVFWLKRSFEYDYKNGDTIIELKSNLNSRDCANYIDSLRTSINQYISLIPSDTDDFEREVYIHDLIVNNCEYDYDTAENGTDWKSFTVLGALSDGLAVCEGYAKSFKLLLNLCGINSILVLGYGQDQPHMWNVVKINGDWYHADITWDDSKDNNFYNYLNLSEETILTDHSLDEEFPKDLNTIQDNRSFNFKLPECNSMEYNYHYKNTYILEEFSQATDYDIINEICYAVLSNQTSYSLIIGNDMDYQDAINTLLKNEPYKLFYYLMKANDFLTDEYNITLYYSSVSYYQYEPLRLLTITLKYDKEYNT